MIVIILVGIWFIVHNQKYFIVFKRLSLTDLSTSGSTMGHYYLIVYALKLKFDNIWNVIFGIGPGNFAESLSHSNIDINEIKYFDIGAYRTIVSGTIPVHSAHIQIFLEFSIFGFCRYIKFLWTISKEAWINKMWDVICIFFPLMGAVMFYSTHNELLYYIIFLYCYAIEKNNKKDRMR